MKNIRKFNTTADMDSAVIEEYSISYVNEENKVYTTPENGGQDDTGYSAMYTTFEALSDGSFSFSKNGDGDDMQYSKDNGETWTSLASSESVNVVTGDKVMWKSNITPSSSGIGTFSSNINFNAYGNTMSLLYGDGFKGQTSLEGKDNVFYKLFKENDYLIDASNLILPATTLAYGCYWSMFYNCRCLTTAPELPATTLTEKCYNSMFFQCRNLKTAPSILPATTLAIRCYSEMFSLCINLKTAPELPATTLVENCYDNMFQSCNNLNHITMLATNISATKCLYFWVYSVSSTGTFVKHPDMKSLPTGRSGIPSGWVVEDAVV